MKVKPKFIIVHSTDHDTGKTSECLIAAKTIQSVVHSQHKTHNSIISYQPGNKFLSPYLIVPCIETPEQIKAKLKNLGFKFI